MTAPDKELIAAEMAVVFEMLDDAEDDVREGRFGSAISRGYYAVFHAARAAGCARGWSGYA